MKQHLPVDDAIEEIKKRFSQKQNLLIMAAPGAGKTTRIAPHLLSITPLKILMLQPRRIAARASAERIAEENCWKLGHDVGYRVRFEDRTSEQTRLIVVTEALLLRELQQNPNLNEYGIIILDEFHERNLYTDTGLAAIRELQQLQRPDLKIIVMSATMDPKPLLNYLSPADLIQVPGRTHPIEIFYDQRPQQLNTNSAFIDRVVSKIIETTPDNNKKDHQTNHTYHTLVFLPGFSEIQRVQKNLISHSRWPELQRKICPLHGHLSLKEQHIVLQNNNEPKIILATNIAETSLTIDGVNTVIDSGLSRELQWDQRRLFPWLKTSRISKASAEQRKGRAGRQYPGRCFRLWTKLDDQSMPEFAPSDISHQDLTDITLILLHLGITDPNNFSWFEKPNQNNLERGIQLLFQLGLIENPTSPYRLTAKGQWIQKVPLNPRLASLVYSGMQSQQITLALQIAVLLNERDPWSKENLESHLTEAQDSDLIPRLQALNQTSVPSEFKVHEQSLKQLSKILFNHAKENKINLNKKEETSSSLLASEPIKSSKSMFKPRIEHDELAKNITPLLLSCFSDRIARRRQTGESKARVVGQKGVELSNLSLVRQTEFFFCLQGHAHEANGNAIVDLAHPLSKNTILNFYESEIETRQEELFFPEKESWMSSEQKYFRDLPLEEPSLKPLKMNQDTLLKIARQSFESWKQTIPSLIQWSLRLNLAQKLWPHWSWPDLSQWEKDTLEMACLGEESLQNIREKNWPELFYYALSHEQKLLFTQELPEDLITSKGKKLPLHYDPSGLVNLELKIQDAFGWTETPRIAQGRIKLRLILLGPHGRPLQTTDDLESFWKGAYLEMRPTLKARYPKHAWPENPSSGNLSP